MKLLFLVVNVIYLNFVFCFWKENAGPYRIILSVNSIRMCDKVGRKSIWTDIKIYKCNETHLAATGNITFNIEISNNLWIREFVQFKPKGSDKWNNIISVHMKACDALDGYAKKALSDLLDNAGFKYKCPLPKGIYYVKDYIINIDRIDNVPILPYGTIKWQIILFSTKRNRKVLESCVELLSEAVPKE